MSSPPSNQTDPDAKGRDDAPIGRAFQWSPLVWVIIAAVAAVAVWRLNRPSATPAGQQAPLTSPNAPQKAVAEIPEAKFTDITAASGLTFLQDRKSVV